jgi:hypothetical protein
MDKIRRLAVDLFHFLYQELVFHKMSFLFEVFKPHQAHADRERGPPSAHAIFSKMLFNRCVLCLNHFILYVFRHNVPGEKENK